MTQDLDEAIHDQLQPPAPVQNRQKSKVFSDHMGTLDWMAALAPASEWGSDIDTFAATEFGLLSNLPQPASSMAASRVALFDFEGPPALSSSTIPDAGNQELRQTIFSQDSVATSSVEEQSDPSIWPVSSTPALSASTSPSSVAVIDPSLEHSHPGEHQFSSGSSLLQEKQPAPSSIQTGGEWLQSLVDVNVQLFNHANNEKNQECKGSSAATDGPRHDHDALVKSFDETLLLSQRLLRVLCNLYSQGSRNTSHNQPRANPRSPPPLDAGSTLIMMSCYVRVLELFMERLGAIKGSLADITAPSPALLPLPTLTAFSCSLDGYPVLRLRMTLELMEHTLDVLGALLMPIVSGSNNQGTDGEKGGALHGSGVMHQGSAESLMVREEAAYQLIREIRTGLKTGRRGLDHRVYGSSLKKSLLLV